MTTDKHTILYVDDDDDYLDAVEQILNSAGYDMVRASTAEEGLEAFRASDPDVILVDLMMEEVDAGTALVRELERWATT